MYKILPNYCKFAMDIGPKKNQNDIQYNDIDKYSQDINKLMTNINKVEQIIGYSNLKDVLGFLKKIDPTNDEFIKTCDRSIPARNKHTLHNLPVKFTNDNSRFLRKVPILKNIPNDKIHAQNHLRQNIENKTTYSTSTSGSHKISIAKKVLQQMEEPVNKNIPLRTYINRTQIIKTNNTDLMVNNPSSSIKSILKSSDMSRPSITKHVSYNTNVMVRDISLTTVIMAKKKPKNSVKSSQGNVKKNNPQYMQFANDNKKKTPSNPVKKLTKLPNTKQNVKNPSLIKVVTSKMPKIKETHDNTKNNNIQNESTEANTTKKWPLTKKDNDKKPTELNTVSLTKDNRNIIFAPLIQDLSIKMTTTGSFKVPEHITKNKIVQKRPPAKYPMKKDHY